jgi:hypothetical protein
MLITVRLLAFVTTALTLTANAGCAKPQADFWIDGLTLPRGATERTRQEVTEPAQLPDPEFFRGGNVPQRELIVTFDHGAGWERVAAHLDKCMKAAGFAERFGTIAALAPGAQQNPMSKAMRIYELPGGKYEVLAVDTQQLKLASNNPAAPSASEGRYMLRVVEF